MFFILGQQFKVKLEKIKAEAQAATLNPTKRRKIVKQTFFPNISHQD